MTADAVGFLLCCSLKFVLNTQSVFCLNISVSIYVYWQIGTAQASWLLTAHITIAGHLAEGTECVLLKSKSIYDLSCALSLSLSKNVFGGWLSCELGTNVSPEVR